MRRNVLVVAAGVMGLLFASSGRAVDGAIEINAVAAAAGGVTPGDAPGFPVSLSRPGRYVFTGDLDLPSAGVTAIEILAEAITVDLNDFTIRGVVTCSGAPTVCTPSGAGVGILGTTAYTVVRGGRVVGMGNDCIRLGASARVEGVAVAQCGDEGIELGLFAVVRDAQSIAAAGDGIAVGGSSRVRDSQAYSSGGFGIRTSSHAIVEGNQLAGNDDGGVWVTDGVVQGNSIVGNTGSGVLLDGAASVVGNLIARNGVSGTGGGNVDSAVVAHNALVANTFSGVSNMNDLLVVENVVSGNSTGVGCPDLAGITDSCAVLENAVARNTGLGIAGTALPGYSANVVTGNGIDVVGPGSVGFGANICGADTICP